VIRVVSQLWDLRHHFMKQCPYCGAEYPDEVTVCAIDETPLEEPQSQDKPGTPWIERIWTPYLIFCSVVTGFVVLLYLTTWQRMNDALPALPLTILRLDVFLRPLFIVAIWWKSRWGVVALIASCFIGSCVNLGMLGPGIAVRGIIGCVVFTILVRPQWRQMTWDVQMLVDKSDDV
jgi:hypothetical protein